MRIYLFPHQTLQFVIKRLQLYWSKKRTMAAYFVLLRLIIVMAYVLIFPLHPSVGKKAKRVTHCEQVLSVTIFLKYSH